MLPALVLGVGLALLGSGCSGIPEAHYLPTGYEGPVVVVFNAPAGITPPHDSKGRVVYEIPADGMLFIGGPFPRGWNELPVFYYRSGGGNPIEIPLAISGKDAQPGLLQVFDYGGGASSRPNDVQADPVRYIAYLVGRPENRDALWSDREKLIDRVVSRVIELESKER